MFGSKIRRISSSNCKIVHENSRIVIVFYIASSPPLLYSVYGWLWSRLWWRPPDERPQLNGAKGVRSNRLTPLFFPLAPVVNALKLRKEAFFGRIVVFSS